MKCKPNCAPGGIFSKTRLASCSGEILAGFTGEYWRAAPARYWLDTRQDPPARDTQRDTRRDPLASYSGRNWWAALVGFSAGSTGELLWWDTSSEVLWDNQRDARRDPLASYSGILSGVLGGTHWRAALAGNSAGSTGEPLWRDIRRDLLASSSGGILGGIHWRATLGYSARCSAGPAGGLLWRDTGQDPLASSAGGIMLDLL